MTSFGNNEKSIKQFEFITKGNIMSIIQLSKGNFSKCSNKTAATTTTLTVNSFYDYYKNNMK